MAFSSYASSDNPLPSASSIIASVLPSVYDTSVISDAFVREQDLVEASEHYSLLQVNMNRLAPIAYSFPPVFLGSGASYRVYMRKLPQWSELVAVKYIKSKASPGLVENVPSVELQRTTILREILVLGQFKDHPNIITLLGWGQSGGNLNPTNVDWSINNNVCLITEYAPLGNLQSFLQERGYILQSNQLLKISAGVAEGIRALHSQAIVHGDIKTANILVFEQPPGSSQYIAKISDLGYSIILGLGDEDTHYCGTDLYNAPEIRSKGPEKVQGIDLLACDIYSLGLLIWTVFQRGRFFLDGIADIATENGLEVQILDSVGPFRVLEHALRFPQAQRLQEEAKTLELAFSACLAVDPAARLPISNVCQILDPSAPAM
jgi:serine/threonine protein kinase